MTLKELQVLATKMRIKTGPKWKRLKLEQAIGRERLIRLTHEQKKNVAMPEEPQVPDEAGDLRKHKAMALRYLTSAKKQGAALAEKLVGLLENPQEAEAAARGYIVVASLAFQSIVTFQQVTDGPIPRQRASKLRRKAEANAIVAKITKLVPKVRQMPQEMIGEIDGKLQQIFTLADEERIRSGSANYLDKAQHWLREGLEAQETRRKTYTDKASSFMSLGLKPQRDQNGAWRLNGTMISNKKARELLTQYEH